MEEKEKQYVSMIARTGSITKAAEQLFISQPSLTQALHHIEGKYGTTFFNRGRNGFELTEKGTIYLNAAKKIEDLYRQMKREISNIGEACSENINLGISSIQSSILMPALQTQCRAVLPGLKINYIEACSGQLEEMVLNGMLDIALVYKIFRTPGIKYTTLYRESVMLAVPCGDRDWERLSKDNPEPNVTGKIMKNKKYLLAKEQHRIRQIADIICSTAAVSPDVIFETGDIATSIMLVEKGMGVAFVPRSYVNGLRPKYSFEVFSFPPAWNGKWELTAAFRSDTVLSECEKELIRLAQETLARNCGIYK